MEGDLKNLAAGDISGDIPLATATPMIEDDTSPLATAATSFPEAPLEGVKKPEVLDLKQEMKDDNANLARPKAEDAEVAEDEEGEEDNALHLSMYFISLEDRLPAAALDLVYWRQPSLSAAVFLSLFSLLVAFSWFSCVSVVSYLALLVLCATISFVTFKRVAAAVQKTGEGECDFVMVPFCFNFSAFDQHCFFTSMT